jgi:hypothetical protein
MWIVVELTGSVLIDANGTRYDFEETGRIFSRHRKFVNADNAAEKLRREGRKARVRLPGIGESSTRREKVSAVTG